MALKKTLSIVFSLLFITYLLNLPSIDGRQLMSYDAKVKSSYVFNIPPPQNSNNTNIVNKSDPQHSTPPAPRSNTPIHN
ncbi:hypothetical protein SLEP1_g49992 [Rubroshorea leprosula]|uniref:Transmembrane protein n=1 Tax=Rubroshorea leprosula TaxID=152421 RepID=A0AAV5LYQ6_9ROSI|nr:hypothetical protein SLEP1_g49992 [Rubroshorea leprosula]